MSTKRRKIVILVTVGTVAFLASGTYTGLRWYMRDLRRACCFLMYGSAVQIHHIDKTPLPDSLDELIAEYNASDVRKVTIPYSTEWPLPDYRPVPSSFGAGPYLVLVERPPTKWYEFGRMVLYAYPDGKVAKTRRVSGNELTGLIAEDDRLRREAAVRTTMPASTTATE